MRSNRAWRMAVLMQAAVLASAMPGGAALAGDEPPAPAWVDGLQPAKKKLIADQMKTTSQRRAEMERDLKKLRYDYFRTPRGEQGAGPRGSRRSRRTPTR
jgi:hypothetical protein